MRQVAIIFHGIGSPGRALEPGEAAYWISIARFEAVLDRIMALPDPGSVTITFDDGNLSDHDVALPRLRDRGLTAEVFALSGRIGLPGSLGPDHLHALQAAGIGIGSHGVAHRNWRRISPSDLADELSRSRDDLSAICGTQVISAAIPFGSYNAAVLTALRTSGYTAVWTSDRGPHDPRATLRPRTSIRADTSEDQLSNILSGRMATAARLRRALGMARRRMFAG
jgi:peptidoglycan/xylan/chitin deacetylase (PgdA/CDA1 family)